MDCFVKSITLPSFSGLNVGKPFKVPNNYSTKRIRFRRYHWKFVAKTFPESARNNALILTIHLLHNDATTNKQKNSIVYFMQSISDDDDMYLHSLPVPRLMITIGFHPIG